MQYRREIDGLRAVTVVPVILFHAGFSAFSGGYVGVDVFFVVSGYLITSILIAELEAGKFSLLRFYERRARRILPALFTVMAAVIPLGWALMLPNRFKDLLDSVVAVVFFGSNILFWREYGYFAPEVELKPLLHTWSLAVEEQFYLLFPLSLLLVWRFGRHRALWAIAAVAVISLLISEWAARFAPTANFYLAPPRAWELMAGAICAFVLAGRAPWSGNVSSIIGLGLIIGSVFIYDERTPFPSAYALVPVGGTVLIILHAGAGTLVARLLSSAGFVGIGLISYSAYLWHQPIFAFTRLSGFRDPNGLVWGGLSVLAFALAWVTWYFVEQPVRKRVNPLFATRRQVFTASAGAGAVFVMIGLAGHFSNGFYYRMTPAERAVFQYLDYPVTDFYRKGTCLLTADQNYRDFEESCWLSAQSLLIGDSHAAAFGLGIRADYKVGELTQTSCPPLLDFVVVNQPSCRGINDFRFKIIEQTRPRNVYLHAAWLEYWYKPGFQKKFAQTLSRLSAVGSRVVIIGGVPRFYPNLPEMILTNHTDLVPGAVVRVHLAALRQVNAELRRVGLRYGAQFWDPIENLCLGDDCLAVVALQDADFRALDVGLMSFDTGHLTLSGSVLVADRFFADVGE